MITSCAEIDENFVILYRSKEETILPDIIFKTFWCDDGVAPAYSKTATAGIPEEKRTIPLSPPQFPS
jgi:hypothetical protein